MKLSPSQEDACCTASEKLSIMFWNSKVHCRVHTSPSLVATPSQISPTYTTPSCHPHLRLGLPSGHFPSGDKASPYFRQVRIGNLPDKCLSVWTLREVSFKHILIGLNDFINTRTLWQYYAIISSSLNRKLSWSVWLIYVLLYCTPYCLQQLMSAKNPISSWAVTSESTLMIPNNCIYI
jgi:hypothetical protein